MIHLKGIFPPLPTPFDIEEELIPEKIGANIATLLKSNLAGILVLGSNGELVMLNDYEKEVVYNSARAAVPSDKLLLAGTGGQSTREAVALSRTANRAGADALLLLNPFYYKAQLSNSALLSYFHEVADASECPVIIYNMPGNTGIDMNAETILRISEHENIIGLKDSGGNIVKMAEVVSNAKSGFNVLAGSAGFLLPALAVGATGGVLALANIAPEICLSIMESFESGNSSRARLMQGHIVKLNSAVTAGGGVPALKTVMDSIGLYGGTARKPFLPLEKNESEKLLALYKKTITDIEKI